MISIFKKNKLFFHVSILLCVFGIFFGTTHLINAQTPTAIALSGYAWGAAKDTPCTTTPCEGSGIGWIMFRGTGYGVNIVGDLLVGTAQSPLLGWLDFGGLSGFPISNSTYCGSTGNCNAHIEGDTVYGWARFRANKGNNSDWDGWIALHGPNFGIQKVPFGGSGKFSLAGNAWGSSGFGPGWIKFPNQGDPDVPVPPDPEDPDGCVGVCSGGAPSPVYSCSGAPNNNHSVTWTISILNPEVGVAYEYAFVSPSDDGYTQSRGGSATFITNPYGAEVNSALMNFSVYRNNEPVPVIDNDQCAVANFGATTVASPISIKAQKSGGVELPQITVSRGDSFTIVSNIGGYQEGSCKVNNTDFSVFGLSGTHPVFSKTLIADTSQNYVLSCQEAGLNDGKTVTQTTSVRVIDNGQTEEF